MEYSGTRSAPNLQSPTNHIQIDNIQNYSESGSNHSNDASVLSPVQYNIYDEKHHYQYQSQAPSLNQLLQNNQCGPYGNTPLRSSVSSNFNTNYWNVPRSQNETMRMYYTQYQDTYPQHVNNVDYSKVDKMKCSDHSVPVIDRNYISDKKIFQNDSSDKPRSVLNDWKLNNFKSDSVSPKDPTKLESDKLLDKSNFIEMPDSVSSKSESHINTDYNSNTSCVETQVKNDNMYHNSNYSHENKINQSQLKHVNQVGYDNSNFSQIMMNQNANYYGQFRYSNPQINNPNYINSNNNPMMTNVMDCPTIANYPSYMQTPNPVPGYGYPQMSMHQARPPYNLQAPYGTRSDQVPFTGHQDVYMNGSTHPRYSGGIKESADRKEDSVPPVLVKQETSDSGSTSNKSITARSTKSKNTIKNESHPTTPVSNTIPSPSQTSMSSIIDENEDSVSSFGPNDSNNIIHHPISQFNQQHISPNMSQSQAMMYPQQYQNNNQIPHPMIGSFPGHMASGQPRPFTAQPNIVSGRQYHHQNDAPISNSCFQKLLDLGQEPDRGPWIERYLKFMHDNNSPLSAVPTVVKQPLDLFRLYHAVRDRGGLLNVVKTKRWKEICLIVNVNASASGAYTLRRNYIKCLLDFECRFDRNGADPGPILQEIQSLSDKKKKATPKTTTGSSSSSTISSGQASQHNSDFISNPSTPRPSLPPADFNSPHGFPGHSPYSSNPHHNGSMMQRIPMSYQNQRSPYPGQYPVPRMMGFNSPPGPMHQQQPIRYDINSMPPNWNKQSPTMNPQPPQQWSSPGSSSNSSSTHPMQMSMSPGTPTNSISNSSQQSQQAGDNFEVNAKDTNVKLESRARISDNIAKIPDTNYIDKDYDKIETSSKSDQTCYNQPYSNYPAPDNSFDYYTNGKNMSANVNPQIQYPGYQFSRQYGSTYRQCAPNSHSFPSYYPPNSPYIYPPGSIAPSSNMTDNVHHVPNSTSSSSQYYPNSLQEHTRRMEWKSNYGGMPPPAAPPPAPGQTTTIRGPIPASPSMHPNNYPGLSHQSFPQQRSLNNQSPSPLSMMTPNRHMLPSPVSNSEHHHPNKSNGSVLPLTSSSLSSSVTTVPMQYGLASVNSHSRSSSDNTNNSRLSSQSAQLSSLPTQLTHTKSSSNLLTKYDHLFPPNCVEVTQLDFSKKRKYSSKDIKTFNSTTVTMALKSGLVAEISWALNYLNIWSRDDSCLDKLSLKNIMPMFQALIEVWRNSLANVYGDDLFRKDLELPVCLDEKTPKYDLRDILKKIEITLNNRLIENNDKAYVQQNEVSDNLQLIKKKIVEMLDNGKYNTDKNGLMVKLDETSKIDTIFGTEMDLLDFIVGTCKELGLNIEGTKMSDGENQKINISLSDLWPLGGSDSTFHILPPMHCQTNKVVIGDWLSHLNGYIGCESDNGGEPPEIKRSRSTSPSSPAPPNLLFDSGDNHRSFIDSGESLFADVSEADEQAMLRCLCVSTAIRNLSFVAGNDRIMSSSRGLLALLGRLLLLGHRHGGSEDQGQTEWHWWHRWTEDIREHVLVTLVNVAGHLHLDSCPNSVVQPLVAGVLHWLTCRSPEAEDPLPSHRVLSCRRLALETLMRLCVHDGNIDYIVSPPSQDKAVSGSLRDLMDCLADWFCHPETGVVREMSLAVMYYLSSVTDDTSGHESMSVLASMARAEPSVIDGLLAFIEATETQIRHVVDHMGMEALQAKPDLMGTSLELLRHSGALLLRLATNEANRWRFTRDHEVRMLALVISTVLDQTVAQSLSGVLYLLSRRDALSRSGYDIPGLLQGYIASDDIATTDNRFKAFLAFDDLSFCDKDDRSRSLDNDHNPVSIDDTCTE